MSSATIAQTSVKRPVPTASGRLFLVLIAVCTAVTAANIYLAGPLLPLIAHDFGSTPSAVAWIASVAQFGYATGLLFFAETKWVKKEMFRATRHAAGNAYRYTRLHLNT
ncbi:hypothetical protein ACFWP5_17375, partial [Streptomyces sp. NPDC058469]